MMPNKKGTLTRYQQLCNAVAGHMSDECLIWRGNIDICGYGTLWYQRRTTKAHRIAFKLTHDRWPNPHALHTCDNSACYNPFHLWEGTDADNMRDRDDKGRQARGEKQALCKLTEDIVRKIRAEYIPRHNGYVKLAIKFGVYSSTIQKILSRQTWKHVN